MANKAKSLPPIRLARNTIAETLKEMANRAPPTINVDELVKSYGNEISLLFAAGHNSSEIATDYIEREAMAGRQLSQAAQNAVRRAFTELQDRYFDGSLAARHRRSRAAKAETAVVREAKSNPESSASTAQIRSAVAELSAVRDQITHIVGQAGPAGAVEPSSERVLQQASWSREGQL